MAVTIRAWDTLATYEDGRWTSSDPKLEVFLNLLKPRDPYSPAHGWPDVYVAEDAVRQLRPHAALVEISPRPPHRDDIVY